MPPINQERVDQFLRDWNTSAGRTATNPLWIEVQGVSSLMSVDLSTNAVAFKANEGFIVKAFLNTETGEVKMFNVRRFTRN